MFCFTIVFIKFCCQLQYTSDSSEEKLNGYEEKSSINLYFLSFDVVQMAGNFEIEVKKICVKKCMRFLPHDEKT